MEWGPQWVSPMELAPPIPRVSSDRVEALVDFTTINKPTHPDTTGMTIVILAHSEIFEDLPFHRVCLHPQTAVRRGRQKQMVYLRDRPLQQMVIG